MQYFALAGNSVPQFPHLIAKMGAPWDEAGCT
jgi:hypothetical protein